MCMTIIERICTRTDFPQVIIQKHCRLGLTHWHWEQRTDNALSELSHRSQKVPLECLKHMTLHNFTQVRGNNVHVVAQHYNNGYYKAIVNLPLSYNLTTVL